MSTHAAVARTARHWMRSASLIAGLTAGLCVAMAHAEPGYPTRPVRIIVPYAAGGIADVTMRILAQKLSERLGQQFIIDNRPGAGGIVAAKAGIAVEPDGYMLSMIGNNNAIAKSLFKSLPYDVLKDFTPISATAFFDILIVTRAGSPFKSIKDIVAAAKAEPGRLNVGSITPGSTQHLAAELFKSAVGVKITGVTYRTGPELAAAILRGDVDFAFEYYAALQGPMSDKQVIALATTGAARPILLPDVPTVNESGIPGYEVTSWNGIAGPAGTPADIVKLLNREINAVMALPDVQEKTRQFGMDGRGSTPEEMDARMKADIDKWAAVIEKAGLEKQ